MKTGLIGLFHSSIACLTVVFLPIIVKNLKDKMQNGL